MASPLIVSLEAILERLKQLAVQDDALRAGLRGLAEAYLALTEPGQPAAGEAPAAPAAPPSPEPAAPAVPAAASPPVPPLTEPIAAAVTAADRRPAPPPERSLASPAGEPVSVAWSMRGVSVTDADLPCIIERCRLKAEAARWAATRRRLVTQGADFRTDVEPRDRDIIARAKALPDCFLWMCHPTGPAPSDLAVYEQVAGCFEAVADAATLMKTILDDLEPHPAEFEQALDLLAEAQSALRAVVVRLGVPTDTDQNQVFNWLKQTAAHNQIFIRRYMRIDDPANPANWADLSARIGAVDGRLQEVHKRARLRKKLLGKVRHKVTLIAGAPPGDQAENWRLLAGTVDELVKLGVPPSSTDIRELLLPLIDAVPPLADLPRGFQLVLREIDRYLATCPPADEGAAPREASAEVRKAAQLLAGRSAVLIGGQRRPAASEALEQALGLRELIWLETREHQSFTDFEPAVARSDVAVVLLAIRWSSHSFGEVKQFCDLYDKPLVRLPAGYSPNQVATQIVAQVSERLRAG